MHHGGGGGSMHHTVEGGTWASWRGDMHHRGRRSVCDIGGGGDQVYMGEEERMHHEREVGCIIEGGGEGMLHMVILWRTGTS
jgi:hypothetical protein